MSAWSPCPTIFCYCQPPCQTPFTPLCRPTCPTPCRPFFSLSATMSATSSATMLATSDVQTDGRADRVDARDTCMSKKGIQDALQIHFWKFTINRFCVRHHDFSCYIQFQYKLNHRYHHCFSYHMCEMHRMSMVHAKTNGAHTLEAFSIIITIISIDTKKVMLLIFRTYFVWWMLFWLWKKNLILFPSVLIAFVKHDKMKTAISSAGKKAQIQKSGSIFDRRMGFNKVQ